MSQETPTLGSRSIPITPHAEISSMPTAPLQLSDLDAVSIRRERDINAVSLRSARPPRVSAIQLCGCFNHRSYRPHESRAQLSARYKSESTSMGSPDSSHADHRQESPGPDKKEKLKWYLMTLIINQSLEAKIPEFTHDTGHVEEEQQVAKPKDPEWIIIIKEKLEDATRAHEAGLWAKLCIYRIPQRLRDAGDEDTYIPQVVSLGPYHHGKKRLKGMEFPKWRALQRMLKKTKQPIELYLEGVKKLEERARACYQGVIGLSSNQFAEMMVLDSCFILDIFRGFANGFPKLGYPKNDPVFAMRATMQLIQRDMVMLENQIPLFVLDKVLGLQIGNPNQKGTVAELAIKFFDPLTPTDEPKSDRIKSVAKKMDYDPLLEQDGLHSLEVFRRNLLDIPTHSKHIPPRLGMGTHANPTVDKRHQLMVHCAIELREAGIKFKRLNTDKFWNIQYEKGVLKGVLKIPRLLIHDGTKSLLLNLIAYERCHIGCTNHVTAYVIFMDNLIDTAADVSFLHRRGIIEHWLGNDQDVADLFSQLNRTCQEVVFDINGNYLSFVSKQVNEYYHGKWNNRIANLNHTYFTNPWTIISLLAAGVLLLLTLAQTFYTIYGYHRPS